MSDQWTDLAHRCRTIGRVAGLVCQRSDDFIAACTSEQRTDPVETVTGELIPFCAGLQFLRKRGRSILVSRRFGLRGRPLWLWGLRSNVQRVALGRVLILGTWNYPVLLSGAQIAQALVAGNKVQLKPAPGTEESAALLCGVFYDAGVPSDQLELLDSSVAAATQAIASGPDLIVLTGAAGTGKKVLQAAAESLSQCIMELSGCDAVVVLDGADRKRLVAAIRFGLQFNSGATCIGPRRLMLSRDDQETQDLIASELRLMPEVTVHPAARAGVLEALQQAFASGAEDVLGRFDLQALQQTGKMAPVMLAGVTADQPIAQADLFAPVMSVIRYGRPDEVVRWVNDCPYRLAASLFGQRDQAIRLAEQFSVGSVVINDLIAPTADPRLPFGGRGSSGFGVTRGAEGLLSMTTPKVISVRKGKLLPHLQPRRPGDLARLHGLLHFLHADSLAAKCKAILRMAGRGKDEPR